MSGIRWFDTLPEHIEQQLYVVELIRNVQYIVRGDDLYWYNDTLYWSDKVGYGHKVSKLGEYTS